MGTLAGFRFFAVPGHHLALSAPVPAEEVLELQLPDLKEAVERALSGAEFRDVRARDRLRSILAAATPPGGQAPFPGVGVFARPPDDLPALLRLADQLDHLAKGESGERALVWRCARCQKRYAVPIVLARPVTIACEGCSAPVELHPAKSEGEEVLLDPFSGKVQEARRKLAEFFREAMARGWAVLVAGS